MVAAERVERVFRFANFAEAMVFADKLAEVADQENHHPDLHMSWGKVGVELSHSRSAGCRRTTS